MKGRIEISGELCKECDLCIICCKKKLISKGNKYNAKGYFPAIFDKSNEECNACQTCAVVCPEVAIEVYGE